MEVWTRGDQAVVKCSYEEKAIVKAIGDYRWDKGAQNWIFPIRKLIDIIDKLHIKYSPETKKVYEQLVKEKHALHGKVNLANKIKAGTLTKEEINNLILELGLDKIDLDSCYEHQKKGILLGALFDSYGFFYDMGLGKTLMMIRLIEYWKKPSLIVSPLSTLESVWQEEIKKWSKLTSVNLWNSLEEFDNDYNIYLINYEQFKKLIKKKNIEKKIGIIAIDESSKLKSYQSQITKAVLSFKNKIPHRFCLSGTPAPNNLMEYFNQSCFINEELLGSNFFRFRNTYFFATGYGNFLYTPYAGTKEAIMTNVGKQAYALHKEDCLSLPDKISECRTIYMDSLQQKAYDEMLKENITELKNCTALGPNELSKIIKLREITGGFIITTEGLPVKVSDSKMNILKEILDEIPNDKQVIIWIQYHWEALTIKELLGEEAVIYAGMISQKEKEKNINDFINNKKKFLIAHPRSAGYGLNLQNCHYVIWYSISYSYEEYTQACDRCHRSGQKQNVVYTHLLAKDSIDEVIYKVITKKEDLAMSCLNMIKGS